LASLITISVNQIPVKEEMVLGLKVGTVAKALSTHPPSALPGVDGLRYSGGVPVSRLEVRDEALPVKATLYAHGSVQPWNATASAVPAMTFSVVLENSAASKPVDATFGIFLPLLQAKHESRARSLTAVVTDITAMSRRGDGARGHRGALTLAGLSRVVEPGALIGCTASTPSARAGWGERDTPPWRARIVEAESLAPHRVRIAWESPHRLHPGLVANETSLLVTCLAGSGSSGASAPPGERWRGVRARSPAECRRACDETAW